MSANNMIELLEFHSCHTYFLVQVKFRSKPRGQPWVSCEPIVTYLYMESFEHRAITSAVNPPRIWKRYVDDTFVILQQSHREFLQHINSVDLSIIFATEETRPDGSMPFLDTLITPHQDGTLKTVYIGSQPTLIYIFSGSAITNTVWSIPTHTGPEQCVPTPSS